MHRPLDHVLKRGHVRKQIETLEDHACTTALFGNLALRQFMQPAIELPVSLKNTAQADLTGRDHLKLVYATQQGGLSRSGRTDGNADLASGDAEVHATQGVKVSVELVDAKKFDGGCD